ELGHVAGLDAGAVEALEARRADAHRVRIAGAVRRLRVADVRHRHHLAGAHDRAVLAGGDAGGAGRRRPRLRGRRGPQRPERHARVAADDADARIDEVVVDQAVAVVVDVVADLGARSHELGAGQAVRTRAAHATAGEGGAARTE